MSVGTLYKATLEDFISHEYKKIPKSNERQKKKISSPLSQNLLRINSNADIAPCVPAIIIPVLLKLTYLKCYLAYALLSLSADPKQRH